jgi:hypothetical protein
MLPTDTQMQALDMFMQQALQANPELITFLDPFKLRRLAMDDVKLAELYMRRCQKKMWQAQQQAAQQQSQQNAQAQQQAVQLKAQLDAAHEQAKAGYDASKNADLSRAQKEQIALQGYFDCLKMGVSLDPDLANEIKTNVLLPLFAENQQNKSALQQGVQQGMAMGQQQPGGPPQPGGLQQPPDQGQQNGQDQNQQQPQLQDQNQPQQ